MPIYDPTHIPDDRTADGMRTVVGLLGAFYRDDVETVGHILDTCDPAPALYAFAALVLSLADQAGESVPKLLETLTVQVPNAGPRAFSEEREK